MLITVKFHQHPNLDIQVNDSETGRLYFDLIKQEYLTQLPVFKDHVIYDFEYLKKLAWQAKSAFDWDWLCDHYDITNTVLFHKDLENSVGKLGFNHIPDKYHDLVYELHHCLHSVQFGIHQHHRRGNFQIEWFTNTRIPLPESFEFSEHSNYGDLILINPHVGHNPLQIYLENDFSSIFTTCKFHDVIVPGIVLTPGLSVSKNQILSTFKEKAPEFVKFHGEEKIKYYSGSAVIGHVKDVDIFRSLRNSANVLVLDSVSFYD